MNAKINIIILCATVSVTADCASAPQLPLQPQPHSRIAPATPATLSGPALHGSWKLTRVDSQPVLPGISLRFDPNGMVRGTLTCGNRLLAFYTVVPTNIVFRQMAMTERGCDDAPALHVASEKTLSSPFSAHLAPNQKVLYIRGVASLQFMRLIFVAEAEAVRKIAESAKAGDDETSAVRALVAARFSCRALAVGEYGRMSVQHFKEWTCSIETAQTETGYRLVYAGLAVDRQGKLLRVATGSYPVVYRNLRIDHLGRTTVSPGQDR